MIIKRGSYIRVLGITALIFVMNVRTLHAQTDCEQQLTLAADEFNAGRFYGIPAMLKPCIDNGFTREQKQRAYMLLTQTYLLLDDPIGAEDSYLKVLQANPEFTTDPNLDPIDVVYLSKKFTADPVFSLYGHIGMNTSIARVIYNVDISSSTNPSTKKYSLLPGIQVAGGIQWHLTKNISAAGEFEMASTGYKRTESKLFGRDVHEFVDRQTWISIPLLINYSDHIGKIRPYGYAGFSVNLLLSDNAQLNILNQTLAGEEVTSQPIESPTLNFVSRRNRLNRSFIVGGGAKLKQGLNYFFADVRYSFGLTNIVNTEKVFTPGNTQDEIVFRYGHADDYLRLDRLSVSVGFIYPLYKPRKLKKARTKSLLKSIKKESDEG